MVYDLVARPIPTVELPHGYVWIPWSPRLIDAHACVKYNGFRDNFDSEIFPSFSSLEGCKRLMDVIASRQGFLPGTTWLIAKSTVDSKMEYCATIQGIQHSPEEGGIQNVAVIPNHRKLGLGKALVLQCLSGFQKAGVRKVALEVTADNYTALHLYTRIGFQTRETVYKAILSNS